MPINFLPYLPKLLGAIAISFALYSGYTHIKQIGFDEATAICEKKFKAYEENVGKKVDSIERLSTTLVINSETGNAALAADVAAILKNSKSKPLVVVKNGECTPSPAFSESISSINKRVNQELMESRK